MVELNTVVEPISEFRYIFEVVFLLLVVFSFFSFMFHVAVEADSKDSRFTHNERRKPFSSRIIYSFLILVFSLFLCSYNSSFIKKAEADNNKLLDETIESNIGVLLKEKDLEIKNGEITLPEIEVIFLTYEEYFVFGGSPSEMDLKVLENKIKKYVYANYDKRNPIYKNLILESKNIF